MMQKKKIDNLRLIAAKASIALALLLALVKVVGVVYTDSVSVLSSLIDSSLDFFAAMATWYGVKISMDPPDAKHRFGHGKAEALTALFQAAFITGSCFFLGMETLERFFTPKPLGQEFVGLFVMGFSVVATALVVLFQLYVVRLTQSAAIKAQAMNFTGDIMTGVGIFVGLFVVKVTGYVIIDAVVAAVVIGFLLYSAWEVGSHAIDELMDKELSRAERAQIETLLTAHPVAKDYHDLRTRKAGDRIFIDFHLELDGEISLEEAHEKSHAVEDALKEAFPDADIVIHQEPHGLDDTRLDDLVDDRKRD